MNLLRRVSPLWILLWGGVSTGLLLGGGLVRVMAQPTSLPFTEDVRSTKHNLSAGPLRDLQKFRQLFSPDTERNIQSVPGPQGTTEVCVFCHTPHGANPAGVEIKAPIWNRNLSQADYVLYDQAWSRSFEAKLNPGAPTGFSRLCLSCHDGTIALGNILNAPGSGGFTRPGDFGTIGVQMQSPTGQASAGPPGSMPVGAGVTTGQTRVLGTDLRNDHPISHVFDEAFAEVDGEMVRPGPPVRRPFTLSTPTPLSPIRLATGESTEVFDTVQCTSCHNPHQVDFPKFLRANRLQDATVKSRSQADRNVGQTIICLFCHDKPGWPYNNSPVNNPPFNTHFDDTTRLKPGATDLGADETPTVAERACLVCHDPHTEQGAIRILREGADEFGNVAIEETCYQCHQPQETSILQPNFPTSAPDIRSQFFKDREGNRHIGLDAGTLQGSAMDLRLGLGHQPVFTDRPREGVQLGSDNAIPAFFGGPPFPGGFTPTSPPGNKAPPEHALPVPDTSHVECVDCHNMHRVTRQNRFQGMPGININGGIVSPTLDFADERREPFIVEVCLRCHGNTFNNHIREETVIAAGTGLQVLLRGNNPVPQNFTAGRNGTVSGVGIRGGGSNKRKEFDPSSIPFYNPSNTPNTNSPALVPKLVDMGAGVNNGLVGNTAFHPSFALGRNQSGVLNNTNEFPKGQLLGLLSRRNTIHCTDCHNTDLFGTGISVGFGDNATFIPDFPGPVTFDDTKGPAYRRPTDLPPSPGIPQEMLNDPNKPQGPHGSIYKRILRNNYDTTLSPNDDTDINDPFGFDPKNFALCFNCHNAEAFSTPDWVNPSENRLTNFYRDGIGNLHWFHLEDRTNARCHECHFNVHSNIEAGNTLYANLPGLEIKNPGHSQSTHLINFAPEITRNDYNNPTWGNGADVNPGDALRGPGCNFRCHGFDMRFNYNAHSVVGGVKTFPPP